mmetsp:Transcript_23676/g.42153  ORF Transcript_23676/g.42153 Transcript_23676/m.42153 type:complete len:242 (-) Transcript_23676:108-833(-)
MMKAKKNETYLSGINNQLLISNSSSRNGKEKKNVKKKKSSNRSYDNSKAVMEGGGVPFSLLRGFVTRQLKKDAVSIARDREAVARLSAEAARARDEANRLRTEPRVFQTSRCAASGLPLEVPALHFLCGHSFNLKSLGDNDQECPLCAMEHHRILEIKRSMQIAARHPDRFFAELSEAADGFSVIAEHFGRGLANATAAATSQATVGNPIHHNGTGSILTSPGDLLGFRSGSSFSFTTQLN